MTFPVLVANPDLGVFVGGLGSRQYFGYRKDPFSSRHSFNVGLAVNRLKAFVSYTGNLSPTACLISTRESISSTLESR